MWTIALVLAVIVSAATPTAASPGQPFSEMPHFRDVWSADACVQQHGQSWDDYWGWVQHFYAGNGGWTARSESVVAKVRDPATRAELADRLASLGVRVSGEWAKANACRKIRTTTGLLNFSERGKPALTTWGKELRDASDRDTGDGVTIRAAIDDVAREVNATLEPP